MRLRPRRRGAGRVLADDATDRVIALYGADRRPLICPAADWLSDGRFGSVPLRHPERDTGNPFYETWIKHLTLSDFHRLTKAQPMLGLRFGRLAIQERDTSADRCHLYRVGYASQVGQSEDDPERVAPVAPFDGHRFGHRLLARRSPRRSRGGPADLSKLGNPR
jgi:hypothetical protein